MKVYIAGDIHARWIYLNYFFDQNPEDCIILQCGDFGYWPHFEKHRIMEFDIRNNNSKIHFCDGNHEDHHSLLKLTDNEICPNVFYMKRGSTLTLPDGRVVLFMGGADSIDKNSRMMGVDWFPEETMTQKDIMKLPNTHIDIVISHTCPREIDIQNEFNDITGRKDNDPSREGLSFVLNKYKPSLWYFAHWHCYATGFLSGTNTKWTCLDQAGYDEDGEEYKWITELE